MKYRLTRFFVFMVMTLCKAQTKDSVIYSQDYSSLFSNTYCFYSDKTFIHEYRTDDFGLTVGKGTYIDKGNTRILFFTQFDTTEYKHEYGWRKFEMNQTRKIKLSKESFKCRDYHHTTRSKWVKFSKVQLETAQPNFIQKDTCENPHFPGGRDALKAFIKSNFALVDSSLCQRGGIVYIQMDIDSTGKILNPIIKRGVKREFDKEALRLIRIMPDWIPMVCDGRPTRTTVIIPLTFSSN